METAVGRKTLAARIARSRRTIDRAVGREERSLEGGSGKAIGRGGER